MGPEYTQSQLMAQNKKKPKSLAVLIQTELVFGEIMYIIADPKQEPYQMIEYKMTPDGLKFRLENMHTKVWLHDFQVSLELDFLKKDQAKYGGDDGEDDL